MKCRVPLLLVLILAAGLNEAHAQAPTVPLVEPDQLAKNPDLVGRTIAVDDRVRFFLSHKTPNGKEIYDELYLKRTDVIFKLPPNLKSNQMPRDRVVQVQGILQREGRQLYCNVETLEPMPSDKDRLNREIARLAPKDMLGRKHWADWAAKRGQAFNDQELLDRAVGLETEILLSEAEKPGTDLVTLAKTAKARRLGDLLADGLAHQGFRARLATAKSAEEIGKLADEIDAFFPNAADPKASQAKGLEEWKARFDLKPVDVYRQAPAPIRAALDRRLFADVVQQRLERKAGEEPGKAMALSEEARQALTDRPEVAARLRDLALASTEAGVTGLRLSEVESLAKTFRMDGSPDRAKKLLETWLQDQRSQRLSASDVDGRILLASHYDRLLSDRSTSVTLLREAIKIDPDSREAADAFRKMGYKKSAEGEWVDSRAPALPPASQTSEAPGAPPLPSTAVGGAESLRGLTPAQVRARFGSKADKVSLSITQNETIEQWMYKRAKGMQIINFRRSRGQGQARVVSSYSLP